jgi:hypothetical protein
MQLNDVQRNCWGHAVAQVVEELCNKPECRGFDSQLGHWTFSTDLILPAAVSSINEYQEYSWGIKGGRPARKADNLTTTFEPIV